MDVNKLMEDHDLSDPEKGLIDESETGNTGAINKSRVVSNIILGKKYEIAMDKLIKSNQKVAESNDKYSTRMTWLTGVLALIGIIDITLRLLGV